MRPRSADTLPSRTLGEIECLRLRKVRPKAGAREHRSQKLVRNCLNQVRSHPSLSLVATLNMIKILLFTGVETRQRGNL